jgi:plasmid maintenance system antidote protein VapI
MTLRVAPSPEAALGPSAEMWLGLPTDHDLWHARKRPPRVRTIAAEPRSG